MTNWAKESPLVQSYLEGERLTLDITERVCELLHSSGHNRMWLARRMRVSRRRLNLMLSGDRLTISDGLAMLFWLGERVDWQFEPYRRG